MENKYTEKRITFAKLRAITRDPSLKPSEKCLLLNLIFYAGIDGNAFPSQETLAKDLCFKTTKTIRILLGALKKKGLLTHWEKRGYSKSNRYFINPELYYPNGNTNGKYDTAQTGTIVPFQSGNHLPPKEITKEDQLNNTNKFVEDLGRNSPDSLQTKELSPERRSVRTQQLKEALYRKMGQV